MTKYETKMGTLINTLQDNEERCSYIIYKLKKHLWNLIKSTLVLRKLIYLIKHIRCPT